VGKAKRTHQFTALMLEDGGHGANAPLPSLPSLWLGPRLRRDDTEKIS